VLEHTLIFATVLTALKIGISPFKCDFSRNVKYENPSSSDESLDDKKFVG